MSAIIAIFFAAIALLCFSPMLNKHERMRRMLKHMEFPNDEERGRMWKKHIRARINFSDAAICCFAGWLFLGTLPGSFAAGMCAGWHIVIPFSVCFVLSIVFPLVSMIHRKRARALGQILGVEALVAPPEARSARRERAEATTLHAGAWKWTLGTGVAVIAINLLMRANDDSSRGNRQSLLPSAPSRYEINERPRSEPTAAAIPGSEAAPLGEPTAAAVPASEAATPG